MSSYLTKQDVCKLLHISKKHLDRMIKRGDISAIVISERIIRFDVEYIKNWLNEKTIGGLK